jgi:hypothetical protein
MGDLRMNPHILSSASRTSAPFPVGNARLDGWSAAAVWGEPEPMNPPRRKDMRHWIAGVLESRSLRRNRTSGK